MNQNAQPSPPAPGGCRAIAWPVFAVALLVALIAIITAVMIARDPGAFVASVWVEQIGKTAAPDEQKQRMVTVIHDIRDRVEAGELTRAQAQAVAQAIAQDHAINAALFYFVAERVQRHTPDSEHDRDAMTRLLQRLTRGAIEGSIDGYAINDLAPLVSRNGRPRDDVTAAELAELRERAEALVAEAGVPDEPYDVDAATLLERRVRDTLAEPTPE